ncbi:hypothetical protein ACFQZW_12865 [Lutibacter aestuarii]|uniref:Major tropism determinant N-terminal domain-containing protein n=1 Tax=Lutibacter aestuarii TaxID=861111 RepID=A0ABW2Z914_9FLAO
MTKILPVQYRLDTAANWAAENPVLLNGEVAKETDTGKKKEGDGVTAYNSLPYLGTDKEDSSNKQDSLAVDGTGTKYPTVDAVNSGLSAKLDASAYNDRFKGKYTSLANLQAAHPTANAGDYAQVDAGAANPVVNYNYDIEDGWVIGNSGSGATTTDELPEGSSNLYFTATRVLATVLTGISFLTGTAVVATDTILVAIGKLQKQINDLKTLTALDASTFNNNLAPTDNTLQKIADKFDAFAGGTSGENISPYVFSTTAYGAISDADISLGSTTFGTDNTTVLQNLLDEALTKPITIIWDGKYSCTGLTIHSNTHIIGSGGSGVILRNASNVPVFQNSNRVLPSATGGYGSNIIDENIVIEDLIINGNGYNTGIGGDAIFDTANNGSAVNGSAQTKRIPIIDFLGAKEVYLNNVKLWAGRYWATSFCNVEQLHIKNLDIDFGLSSTRDDINYDGIHFNGYARWISADGVRIKGTADDAIAINADAIATYYPGYTGPITDGYFKNFYFYETTRGIRILSDTSRIDRLTFDNFKGYVGDLFCLIQGAFWAGSGMGATSDYGSIYFNDIDIELFDDAYYTLNTYIYVDNVVLQNLNINNIVRKDYSISAPYVYISGTNTNITHINITNIREIPDVAFSTPFIKIVEGLIETFNIDNIRRNSSGGNFNSPLIEISSAGQVRYLNINNLVHRDVTSKINADVIKYTGTLLANVFLSNIALTNIAKIVNATSGISNIKALNITHLGSVDASFTTTYIISDLNLSNYSSASVSALITSGTFTNKWGDGFTFRPCVVADLPSASQYLSISLVTNESGGAVPAFSDGTNWRRVTDRAIVS